MKDLEELLKIKIQRPFGIFLSGGLDSGLLAALLKPDFAITCTWDLGEKYNELEYVNKICEFLQLPCLVLKPERKDVRINFEDAVNIIGHPVNSVSIYSWYEIMRHAKLSGAKRMVGGEGADELFGGYSRYIILNKIAEMYRSEYLQNYRPMLDKLFGSVSELESKLVDFEAPELPTENTITAIGLWEYEKTLPPIVDMEYKLAKHFGIDLYLPFMSKRVKKYASELLDKDRIREDITKILLRQIAEDYLPKEVVYRKQKMGFISPILKWLELEDENYEFDKSKYIKLQQEILNASHNRT